MSTNPSAASPLLTDLYQLSMLDAYYQLGMEETAVFEFFVRHLPKSRNFLIAAGLEQALSYLETLRFESEELDWIASTGFFSRTLVNKLSDFRFNGSVDAMPEGTVFFADEPVLRVTANLPEAQFVESRLINLLHFQTAVASKAARCRIAAGDTKLIDFGMRRAHGAEAACLASRACYIAGVDATATLEAGRHFEIPLAGTMAHSFIQAHDSEAEAFERFARCRPDNLVLLIDTYDTERATSCVAALSRRLRSVGVRIRGVRIDSGDLLIATRRVRSILDEAGETDIEILVSGALDEYSIARLRAQNAPIDSYCIGTKISTVSDASVLDCAYKLNQYAGKPRRKLSSGKTTWPGPREIYREYDAAGVIAADRITSIDESAPGQRLLQRVMTQGARTSASPALQSTRDRCKAELQSLPPAVRSLEDTASVPVVTSPREISLATSFAAA